VFGIRVRNPGLVSWLSGQPDEEPFQTAQGGVESRLTETILGPNAHLLRQARLEALGLLDVERLEVAELGVAFEAVHGLRDAVERGLAEAFGLGQIGEVGSLNALVLGVMRFHGLEPSGLSQFTERTALSLSRLRLEQATLPVEGRALAGTSADGFVHVRF